MKIDPLDTPSGSPFWHRLAFNTPPIETPETDAGTTCYASSELLAVGDDERMTTAHYMAIRSDGLTFLACVEAAAGELELVAQVDRLFGTNLMRRQSPIENMIDDATGKADEDKQTFLRFVWNYVFARCAPISSANEIEQPRAVSPLADSACSHL